MATLMHARVLSTYTNGPRAVCSEDKDVALTKDYEHVTCRNCLDKLTTYRQRVISLGRLHSSSCEAGTIGCGINHKLDNGSCETW